MGTRHACARPRNIAAALWSQCPGRGVAGTGGPVLILGSSQQVPGGTDTQQLTEQQKNCPQRRHICLLSSKY